MNNFDDDPRSTPDAFETGPTRQEEPLEPSTTRPFFRIAAGVLALTMVSFGLVSLFQFKLKNSILDIFLVLLGCQFAFAAWTGRWFTLSGKRLG